MTSSESIEESEAQNNTNDGNFYINMIYSLL